MHTEDFRVVCCVVECIGVCVRVRVCVLCCTWYHSCCCSFGSGGKFDSIVSVGEGGTKSKRALDWFAPFTSYR